MKGTRLTSHGQAIVRTPGLLLAFVLVVALALRLLHLSAVSQTAFVDFHRVTASDMHITWQWAKQIAAGDWLGQPPYHPFDNKSNRIASRETWERWQGGPMVFYQSRLEVFRLVIRRTVLPAPVKDSDPLKCQRPYRRLIR